METLRLSGYSEEEKLVIAERFLVPKQIAESGLTSKEIVIGRPVLRKIISEYTREAGLRELERLVAQLARKVARRVVEEGVKPARGGGRGKAAGGPAMSSDEISKHLGPPRYLADEKRGTDEVGTVNGLAWTPYGGEVLLVEAQTMAGKGSLTLTGQLGEVMKESATAALSFARAHALGLGMRDEFYAGREIHIHVPSGGVPKDGPSAGVTMACALVSLISQTPVRHDLAMTGELTLRGKVLPIGGLKEKLLAAVRAGMTQVIIPAGNAPELSEIPEHVRARLTIKPVRTMTEVLEAALVTAPAKARAAGKDPAKTPPRDGGGSNGAKHRGPRSGGKTLSAGSRR
jgi:ATP-dependent Lon protease